MHTLAREVIRERMKFGRAIAANSPMMAATIIISTKVDPELPCFVSFMLHGTSFRTSVNEAEGGYNDELSTNCSLPAAL